MKNTSVFKRFKKALYRILRWSERFTRTDMVYLASGSFWMSVKRVVYAITSFIVAIMFANLFPQEAYGEYKFVLSAAALVAIFSMRGINTSYLRAVSRGYEGGLREATLLRLRWGLVASAAAGMGALYYWIQGNSGLALNFVVVGVFTPPLNALTLFIPLLNGRKQFRLSALYETVVQTVASVAIMVSVALSDQVIIVLLSYFVSYTVVRALASWWVCVRQTPNKKQESDTLSYGVHLSAMSAVGDVASKIDSVLLWYFLGPVAVAVYSFALVPTQHLRSFVQSTGLLALIKLSSKEKHEIKKTLPRKSFILFLAIVPIVVLYIVLAPWLFQLVFPQYLDAVIYTQVLSLNLLFFPKVLFDSALTAHAQKKPLYLMNITGPSVNIALMLILLPLFQIWGVVAASLITQVYKTAMFIYLFKRM